MLVISGIIDVHPDDRAALLKAIAMVMAPSRAEPGCHAYTFSQDLDDPNRLHLFELWADEPSLARHYTTAHFRDYAELSKPLRVSRSINRYTAEALPANAGPRPS